MIYYLYHQSKESVIITARTVLFLKRGIGKGFDLAVPDEIPPDHGSRLRGSLAESENESHDPLADITTEESSESDVIYPSLLENKTGDSTTDVFYPSEDSLSTSLCATNPAAADSSSIPQVVSTRLATRASTSQTQVSPEGVANIASLLLSYRCEKQCLYRT